MVIEGDFPSRRFYTYKALYFIFKFLHYLYVINLLPLSFNTIYLSCAGREKIKNSLSLKANTITRQEIIKPKVLILVFTSRSTPLFCSKVELIAQITLP